MFDVSGFSGLLTAGGILAVIYWVFYCHQGPSALKSSIKTASTLAVLLAAVLAGAQGLVIAALFFCVLGDFLLSREGDGSFMAGVGAFALGHVGFVAAFLTHPYLLPLHLIPFWHWVGIAVLVLVAVIMARLLFSKAGELRFAVLSYVPVIAAMGVSSLMILPILGAQPFWPALRHAKQTSPATTPNPKQQITSRQSRPFAPPKSAKSSMRIPPWPQ